MRPDVKGFSSHEHDIENITAFERAVRDQLSAFDFSTSETPDDAERSLIVSGESDGAAVMPVAAVASARAFQMQTGFGLSRAMDIVGALGLLIFLAPVMVVVAILVFVLDPGPVIFRHERVGRGGQRFSCLKFRTMAVDAQQRLEKYLKQDRRALKQWMEGRKLSPDPRVTPLGMWLRLSSLDELPQLINVLKGEMSLVGPRPIVADELIYYGRYVDHYLAVRPGLTGLWQVSGRSQTTYRRRVAADVLYVRNMSMGFNMKILLATIPAVITAKGSA